MTPITDRAQERIHNATCLPDCDSYGHNERCPYASPEVQAFETARQLERMAGELAACLSRASFIQAGMHARADAALAKWRAMKDAAK